MNSVSLFAWLLFVSSGSHNFNVVDAFGGVSFTKHATTTTTSTSSSLYAIKLPFLTTPTSASNQKPMIPTKSKLTPIQRLKIQQFNNDEGEDAEAMNASLDGKNNNPSKFDAFKSILYSVSDTTKMATQQTVTQLFNAQSTTTNTAATSSISGKVGNSNNNKSNKANNNKVYDGFNSKSTVVKPGLSTFTMTSFRLPFQKESTVVVDIPTKPPSLFDTLKGTVYNTADFITTSASSKSTKVTTAKPSPIQRVSTKSIVKSSSKSSSTVDPFTQLKEGFYTMNDMITKTIETVPTIPQKVEQTSQKTMTFVTRTIPNRAQETVNNVASIPNRIEQTVNDVQSTIENKVEQTKQLIQSIQSIPDQVQDTVTSTQKSMNAVQESMEDITSSIQVQLGLRKPTVQPPKQVPPMKSTASDVMMDVAWTGTRTIGTLVGKSIVWLGQTSLDLAKTTIEDAVKKQKTSDDISLLSSLSISANSDSKKSVTPVTSFNIDEDDILATLKMAEEAIALAADATTVNTATTAASTDTSTTSTISSSTSTTVTSTSTNIPEKVDLNSAAAAADDDDGDDDFDIMATLQMANDAIALAEAATKSNNADGIDDKNIVINNRND